MNQRKRIALLVGQPGEGYQSNFIKGFLKQAFELNWDVCVFAMYHRIQETRPRETGESNIFKLIQLDRFEAVVIMSDTIQTPGAVYKIEKNIKENYKGIVFCVDKASANFTSILMDSYTPVYKTISHLIEVHNMTEIAFLTGQKWHSHSTERLKAFTDCMKDHNLEPCEEMIFYGDFWYDSGAQVGEELLKRRRRLPQAIACANDQMAIGVADVLTKRGYNIPRDIAIVGYGSTEEAKTSPAPITSAVVPSEEFGVHVMKCVQAVSDGKEMPAFCPDFELFIGNSCGCECETIKPILPVRKNWTDISVRGALNNNLGALMEDMLSRNNFSGLMDTIQTYSYQIREFDSFHLCLNAFWDNTKDGEENLIKSGYADKIIPVLICGPSGKGADRLNFTESFSVEEILPDMYKERDIPKAYFFTPLHFEDICFGYAVIGYGNEPKCYGDNYYLWLRNVMFGLEYYRRIAALRAQNQIIEEQKIMDTLTGCFDYNGFQKHAKPMIERVKSIHQYVSVLAIDVCDMSKINAKVGREGGDKVLADLAGMLKQVSGEGAMCCRVGNDEFVMAQISPEDSSELIRKITESLHVAIENYNSNHENVKIEIYAGSKTGRVTNWNDLENLMNIAVSRKNGNKAKALQANTGKTLTKEELLEAQKVGSILDNNLFTYHFQPIINASDGSIYAYEALMRTDVEPRISPLQVIKYAEHLRRLYDVEKATFFNVLKYIEENSDLFDGKKVFINSIPGKQLDGEDAIQIAEKLKAFQSSVVVELTEQSEADDDALDKMKYNFRNMGVETAVDDYGTGYSNIVNLLRYAPNYVKIDRMLLSGIHNNQQKQHFVKSIIGFAHENNFKALAEGVETAEELETVIRLGVDLIQGYYTARPAAEVIQEIPTDIQDEIKTFRSSYNG